MTDALSSQIIRNQILPRFRENDYPGGIMAGADAIIAQFQAPPEAAEQRVLQAQQAQRQQQQRPRRGDSPYPLIFWVVVFGVILVSALRKGANGQRYGRRRRGGGSVFLWGPGLGGGWDGGSSGSSSWGGGGSSWGGGGGGFSGGGGSFGGGGASGGW
jgi:uncharacterized protein